MLTVFIPNICQSEQRYVLDILLDECLGLEFNVKEHNGKYIEVIRAGDAAKLTIDASFFHQAHRFWLKIESMPLLPLEHWNPKGDGIEACLIEQNVPVLYGKSGFAKNDNHYHLCLDVFGSSFFMLSRYEEIITSARDMHDRFPSTASVALSEGFLDRPIINEYLEILWACLHSIWPDLHRKKRIYRKLVSCDVDHPFDLVGHSFKQTILRVLARIIRDHNPRLALYDALNYVYKKFGSDQFDEYRNNINWMMEVNKAAGNRVCFNFIPIQTKAEAEDPNDIRCEKISSLLKHIVGLGHEIGFHPGYNTYRFSNNFRNSVNAFKEACLTKGIEQKNIGGRQHYLRYNVATTPNLWQENGFAYDSTIGYADRAGFRCGICYEYTMYDLVKRQKMTLKQRPLIVMDCSIVSQAYEGLGYSQESVDRILYFKDICQTFNGDFTLLWHNSYFQNVKAKRHYIKYVK